MLLSVDPPKYGRSAAGVSCAIAIHQPAPTITPPNPANTRNACAILVRKAKPSSSPAKTSHRVRSRSSARWTAYPAAVISSTRSASGLLNRKMRAAAGVSARTAPAMRPADGPNQRRTAAYSNATDATPSTACGASSDHELNPNTFADSSSPHSDAGVLSTVMKLDESNEPKKAAFHDFVPACTAAEEKSLA